MKKTREELQRMFTRTLTKLNTYPGIISTLVAALLAYSNDKEVSLGVTDFRGPIDNMILLAIDEQDEIGWDGLHHGLLSTRWAEAQHLYYKEEKLLSRFRNSQY